MAPIIFGNFGGRTTKTPAMWTPFLRVSLLLFAGCTQEVEIPKPDIQLEACFRDEAEACLGAAYELRRAGATDWELVDYLEEKYFELATTQCDAGRPEACEGLAYWTQDWSYLERALALSAARELAALAIPRVPELLSKRKSD